jgi:tight adherence protein C
VNPVFAGGALALCVIAAVAGFLLTRTMPEGVGELLAAPEPRRERSRRRRLDLTDLVETLGRRVSQRALAVMSERRIALIRHRIEAAGRPGGITLERYAGRKAAYTVLLGGVGFVLFVLTGSLVFVPAMAGLGWLLVDFALAGAAKQRQATIDRDLPDFLDVLTVTVTAGLGFRDALGRVAAAMGGPLGQEVIIAIQQMGLGASRRSALEGLRDRNDSQQLAAFVTALLQAEELGTPLADTLTSIAADMRKEFAQRARREAARAAPRVSLIVTMIVVPGAVVLILGALLAGSGFDPGIFSAG